MLNRLLSVLTGEYNLVISEITDEDNALFECQVGATEHTRGLASRKAKLTVQGRPERYCILFSYFYHPRSAERGNIFGGLSVCM